MADASRWLSRTMETRYRFVRVDRETGAEKGVIPVLRGGTVTRNNDVRILETAEVGLVGALDIGPDLVRIYMEPVWPDGHTESVPIGTFLASVPKREVRQGYSTATVKLSGRLQAVEVDG